MRAETSLPETTPAGRVVAARRPGAPWYIGIGYMQDVSEDVVASHQEIGLEDQDILDMYYSMVLARTISEKALLLNRQGRVLFTMACDGQEAADVGSAYALRPGVDFLVPYARDLAALLVLGMTPREVMLNLFARADDPSGGGRQMPMHWGHKPLRIVSMGSPVAVTIPKAVGIALASKIRKEDSVTLVYFGDGASSAGDFHEGLNMAGVLKVPVIFLCNNNGWSTSVPLSKQTAGENIAMRAESYGFPGVAVDGNDVLAVYKATSEAVGRARRGDGPTLIEARTARMMPHSSSDDHRRYRSQEELDEDRKQDPIPRFHDYLSRCGLLAEAEGQALRQRAEVATEEAIEYAESAPVPAPKSALERLYAP